MQEIRKYVLQNAVFYNGKASPEAVLGKIMASEPELRSMANEVRKEIDRIIGEVNQLSHEEQKRQLKGMGARMLKKEVKKHGRLPPLRDAVKGKVVTRFAPSPTGHALRRCRAFSP